MKNSDDALRQAMQQSLRPTVATVPDKPARSTKPKKIKAKTKKPKPAPAPDLELDQDPVPVFTPQVVEGKTEINENRENGILKESGISLKDQLTAMEMDFIEIYMTGKVTIEGAMKSAGYSDYHQSYLYKLGKKIIQKYESRTEDHRKIFRALGAGEVSVAQGLLDLAQNAKSEMVRLNAWQAIAKCLGLQKEVIDVQHGIKIIVNNGPQPAAQEPAAAGGKPALIRLEAPKSPPKPLCITK